METHGPAIAQREHPTVLVVDDDPIVRATVAGLLGNSEFEIVGEAEDGIEAVAMTRGLRPRLVVLDLVMPRLDGVGAIRSILRVSPETRVVVLTSAEDDELGLAALEGGASAVLTKANDLTRLPRLLRQAASGEVAIFGSLLPRLVDRLAQGDLDEN